MSQTDLYQKALELTESGRRFALASVIKSAGSTPQKAGANAIFEASGPVVGTLGGGCLEAESRRRALEALDLGDPLVFDLKLDEVRGWDDGLICGGKVRIFVDPIAQRNAEAYKAMLQARADRQRGALLTIIAHPDHSPGTAIWAPEHQFDDDASICQPSQIKEILESGQPATVTDSSGDAAIEVYVEPIVPSPRLIIAGGGHIGKAMAHMGNLLGFEVTVIDDRPAFANATAIPDARHTICGDIAEEIGSIKIDQDSYVLIVTRGHRHDGAVLAACVHAPAAYIGMIGSRRKSMLIRTSLVEEGIATREEVDRVVCPMGLDIGSQTVHEIAVSIAAQLVAVRRNGQLEGPAKTFVKYDPRYHSRSGAIAPDGRAEAAAPVQEQDRD